MPSNHAWHCPPQGSGLCHPPLAVRGLALPPHPRLAVQADARVSSGLKEDILTWQSKISYLPKSVILLGQVSISPI